MLGDDDPLTLGYMHWFGNFPGSRLNGIEEFLGDDIEHFMLTTVEAYERVYGPDCIESTGTLSNLATRYAAEKRYAEADSLRLAILKIQRRELGDGNPQTAFTMRQLGMGYKKEGRFQEALPLLEEALEVYKEALGETHPYTWRTMGNLASLHRVEGRYREAESLRLESLEILRRTMGEMHRATLAVRRALTILQMAQGRYAEAEPFYRQILPVVKPTFLGAEARWEDTATIGNALVHWGGCLRKLGNHLEADRAFGEADSLLSEAYQRFASSRGSEDAGFHGFVAQVVLSGLGHSVEPEYELTCPCGTCADFYETWIQAREAETSRSELSVSDASENSE